MTDPKPTDVLWEQTLDGLYLCRVVRLTASSGRLTVTDTRFSDTVILTKDVGLMFGAIFGADVDDVAEWQELAEAAIDHNPIEDEIRRRLDEGPTTDD